MNLHHLLRSVPATIRRPAEPLASNDPSADYSREFGEFIESISATPEELAAMVSMPELSVAEIKEFLRDSNTGNPQPNLSAPVRAASQAIVVRIRPPGVRSRHS